jgi:hypothetical protein
LHDRGGCLQEQFVFAVHAPASIEEVAHLDASFSIASVMGAWWDIEDDACEANRIVVADSGLIAKAADPIDIESSGQRPPCGLAFFCRLGEPSIEISFEAAIEKHRRLVRGEISEILCVRHI